MFSSEPLLRTTPEGEIETTDNLPESLTFLPPKRKKISNTSDNISVEALQCMKSLTEAVVKRDSYSIFADFISDSLRTANRPQHEVNRAKQSITQIIFDLQNGLYSRTPHSDPTTPSHHSSSLHQVGVSKQKTPCPIH